MWVSMPLVPKYSLGLRLIYLLLDMLHQHHQTIHNALVMLYNALQLNILSLYSITIISQLLTCSINIIYTNEVPIKGQIFFK